MRTMRFRTQTMKIHKQKDTLLASRPVFQELFGKSLEQVTCSIKLWYAGIVFATMWKGCRRFWGTQGSSVPQRVGKSIAAGTCLHQCGGWRLNREGVLKLSSFDANPCPFLAWRLCVWLGFIGKSLTWSELLPMYRVMMNRYEQYLHPNLSDPVNLCRDLWKNIVVCHNRVQLRNLSIKCLMLLPALWTHHITIPSDLRPAQALKNSLRLDDQCMALSWNHKDFRDTSLVLGSSQKDPDQIQLPTWVAWKLSFMIFGRQESLVGL